MTQLTYPRPAATIATRARMALGAYCAVFPAHEATHQLDSCLLDMWGYTYFAFKNADDTPHWTQLGEQLLNAQQLLKTASTDQPGHAAEAARQAIHRFEQATGTPPPTAPDRLYTRADAEQAANAAFDCLSTYIKLDHWNDRRFVTRAFLAFLDDPDSPYPFKSHDPDDEKTDDEDEDPELTPEKTSERENSLLYRLGPRTDTAPHAQEDQ
ncbi:hypothetical protein [Streptomyces sp. NPDC059783]|uniref:hypothetical protein n=1 Tax=Streptomyces sp. NPDC059783 TaxID=3346944 RepID=UPI003662FBC0